MRATKISRDYIKRHGGFGCGDEPWYDEEVLTLYEGDVCPQCEEGKLIVSKNNKLYCSAVCWLMLDAKVTIGE